VAFWIMLCNALTSVTQTSWDVLTWKCSSFDGLTLKVKNGRNG
jgi:hypothetical protein